MLKEPRNNYHQLVLQLAWTDFKLRYQGSWLGFLWSLLKPLLQFLVLYTVFSLFLPFKMSNYQLYLLLGILIWNYFSEGTNSGLHALAQKANIIKKIYFPRILVVVASSLHTLIALLLNILIFLLIAIISRQQFSLLSLLFLIDLIFLYMLVLGTSLLLSVLYLKFRDINQIWEVLLMAGFYLSPIIYPLEVVPVQYRFIVFLNPMTGLIQYARLLLLEGQIPSWQGVAYVAGVSFASLGFGYLLFQKYSHQAAEEL